MLFCLSACGQNKETKSEESFINYVAIIKYPKPVGFVNDFESLLSFEEKKELDSIIKVFNEESSYQIAIVTIDDIEPYGSLKDFTSDLGNFWGVGEMDEDNGLIITVSKKMRNVWIGTGLGTQKILTDDKLKSVVDTQMIPYFKRDEYFEGIKSGLLKCIESWR